MSKTKTPAYFKNKTFIFSVYRNDKSVEENYQEHTMVTRFLSESKITHTEFKMVIGSWSEPLIVTVPTTDKDYTLVDNFLTLYSQPSMVIIEKGKAYQIDLKKAGNIRESAAALLGTWSGLVAERRKFDIEALSTSLTRVLRFESLFDKAMYVIVPEKDGRPLMYNLEPQTPEKKTKSKKSAKHNLTLLSK